MKTLVAAMLLAGALAQFGGCPSLTRTTSVEMVNATGGLLEVELLYGSNQNTPEAVLEQTGNEVEFTIPNGESRRFTRDCNDIQAVRVRGNVRLVAGLGPSRTSRVYRDGSDFRCGDLIEFTFTTPTIPTELEISFSQRPR